MKRFTKNDNDFICKNCGKQVGALSYTSRNHCPYCLHSLHVDINPGDRENTCQGLLKPIGVEYNKKGRVIVFKCQKCGKVSKNISADDDSEKQILLIMKNNAKY